MTILAVGAAGNFAGLLIPELVRRGARVRGWVRIPEQATAVRAQGAAEVFVGDLCDPASVTQAMRGIDTVFYIPPAFLPNEVAVGRSIVEAAVKAGVRRIVFSAALHLMLGRLPHHADKALVEEAILHSGLEYTLLHPAQYFQNFELVWSRILQSGVFAQPWSVGTRFSRVDFRDVAEVAAIALTQDRLLYGTFELAAPGHLDRAEVAALLSDVLGRDIKAGRRDRAELGAIPPALQAMFDHYEHANMLANPLTLRAILDREPRSLRSYFEEMASRATN